MLPKILLGLLILITLTGSIWFFSQNAEPNSSNKSTESQELANKSETAQETTDPLPAPAPDPSPVSSPDPAPTPTPAPAAPVNSCIITISGERYGISELVKTHSGGNVFKCGQDNTSIFFSRHNQAWLDSRMGKYRIN
jgi:septal ring-binding cell division protein DamX